MALKLGVTSPSPESKPDSPKGKKDDKKLSTGGTLAEVMAAIKKSKGEKVLTSGDQIAIIRRLPTGIFEFDFYVGGGFPCGRYSIVYGQESSCKTNLCLKAVATAQRLPKPCNKAIWVDVEQSFDPQWAQKMGVDISELLVVNAGYGEEAIDLVDALVRAEDVAILVVDSVAGLIASKEIAQSVENADVMSSALLIKRMVNKLMIAFCEERKRNHDPCVVLINQIRFKPTLFGDPMVMPGGEAQKFLASLRVYLSAKNNIDKATHTLMFKDVHAVIKKAKVPVRATDFDFSFCVFEHDDLKIGETDSFNMVKSHLQSLGLLVQLGAGKGYLVKIEPKGQTFQTLSAIADRYQKDLVFQRTLQALVIEHSKEELVVVSEPEFGPKVQSGTPVQVIATDGE